MCGLHQILQVEYPHVVFHLKDFLHLPMLACCAMLAVTYVPECIESVCMQAQEACQHMLEL